MTFREIMIRLMSMSMSILGGALLIALVFALNGCSDPAKAPPPVAVVEALPDLGVKPVKPDECRAAKRIAFPKVKKGQGGTSYSALEEAWVRARAVHQRNMAASSVCEKFVDEHISAPEVKTTEKPS